MKECIICREIKSEFNKEHIIPAAIGGKLTTKSVCKDCNSLLGEKIDNPFNNNKVILYYRNIFSLNRDGRNIKNPFANDIIEENGFRYRQVLKNGAFEKRIIFNMPEATQIGLNGEISITLSKDEEEDLPRIIKRMAKKYKVDPKEIKINDRKVARNSDSQGRIDWEHNPIILEFLKMLYEYACELLPGYFENEDAVIYSRMLFNGEIDRSVLNMISPAQSIFEEIYFPIQNIIDDEPQHLIGIYEHKVHGLIGFGKIFKDLPIFICLLSKSTNFNLNEGFYYKQVLNKM